MTDNFNFGPSLVRGFAPGGIGPRDITNATSNNNGNALGGTDYWGASVETQFPIWGLPKDIGLKGALFFDAGSLWDYTDTTNFGTYLGYPVGESCAVMNAHKNPWTTQLPCINVGSNNMVVRYRRSRPDLALGDGAGGSNSVSCCRNPSTMSCSSSASAAARPFSFMQGYSRARRPAAPCYGACHTNCA